MIFIVYRREKKSLIALGNYKFIIMKLNSFSIYYLPLTLELRHCPHQLAIISRAYARIGTNLSVNEILTQREKKSSIAIGKL